MPKWSAAKIEKNHLKLYLEITLGRISRSTAWKILGMKCSKLEHWTITTKQPFCNFLGRCPHRSSSATDQPFISQYGRMDKWRYTPCKLRHLRRTKLSAILGCLRLWKRSRSCPSASQMNNRQWMDPWCVSRRRGMSFWRRSKGPIRGEFFSMHQTSFCNPFAVTWGRSYQLWRLYPSFHKLHPMETK